MDCVHNGFGEHNCYHFEDAGITCPPEGKHPSYLPVKLMYVCT